MNRQTPTGTPPMWYATYHNGRLLQRRPHGWMIGNGTSRVPVARRDATLADARSAADRIRTGAIVS